VITAVCLLHSDPTFLDHAAALGVTAAASLACVAPVQCAIHDHADKVPAHLQDHTGSHWSCASIKSRVSAVCVCV
jgi:hypothetical protein